MNEEQAKTILKQALSDLRVEQQRRVMQKADKKPQTRDELWNWIRDVLGYRVPRTVTKEGHRAPFEFIADMFFGKETKVLVRACRSGGKTLSFSILHLLNTVFKNDFEVVHIGGTEKQAKQGYTYYAGDPKKEGQVGFIRRPGFNSHLAGDPMVSQTALDNGSKIEIRTGGSAKSVSGPHPNFLAVDELDHIDMNVLNTALQMPTSRGLHQAQVLMGSSQYAYYGTMQILLDSADKRGLAVYQYDMFDILASCGKNYPTECRQIHCPFFEWHNPWTGEKEELCGGRGAIADGFYSYRDAVDKYLLTTDIETFALQNLLMRGTAQGMVYSKFSDKNIEAFPPEGADLSNWRCFAGIDLRSRGRIVVVAESPGILPNGRRLRWVIAEWGDDNNTPSKIRKAAFRMRENIRYEYGLSLDVFWMEPSASDEAADWQMLGLNGHITPKEGRSVAYGIGQLRDAWLDAQDIVSLKVDPRCKGLIHAVEKGYHCKRNPDGGFDRDSPDSDFEDYPDALRYAYVGGPAFLPSRLPEPESRGAWENLAVARWTPY